MKRWWHADIVQIFLAFAWALPVSLVAELVCRALSLGSADSRQVAGAIAFSVAFTNIRIIQERDRATRRSPRPGQTSVCLGSLERERGSESDMEREHGGTSSHD